MVVAETTAGAQGADTHYTHGCKCIVMSPPTACGLSPA